VHDTASAVLPPCAWQ